MAITATALLCLVVAAVPIRGVTYVSWRAGEYPYTCGWRAETYPGIQAVDSVKTSDRNPRRGQGSLAMFVGLGNTPGDSNGEAAVDLRYNPPMSPCPLGRDTLIPMNVEDSVVSAWVWCPSGSGGPPEGRNFLQVFVKDTGWHWWYSRATSIDREEAWLRVADTVRDLLHGGNADTLFDPHQVIWVGLKIGMNLTTHQGFRDTVYLDDFSWHRDTLGASEYGLNHTGTALDSLEATGCNFLSIVNTWYMESTAANSVDSLAGYSHSRDELAATIREAKRHGMRVMLKPQIDVPYAPYDTVFRGKILPADITTWFASYRKFVAWHASINPESTDLFCIGTELSALDTGFLDEWLRVNDTLRSILPLSCSLTYAANWDHDTAYRKVCFWDSLDFAGIDAYFPLCVSDSMPSLAALVADWGHWKDDVRDWHDNLLHKDVAFTEIGYISRRGANIEPYKSGGKAVFSVNESLQARLYSAAIIAWDSLPWFKGRFWWYWSPACDAGGPWHDGYTPQNKAAQDTLRKYWSGIVDVPGPTRGQGMLQTLPNPTRGALRIRSIGSNAVLVLCDASGRMVRQVQPDAAGAAEVDLRALPPGVYFVREAQARAVRKVVITR